MPRHQNEAADADALKPRLLLVTGPAPALHLSTALRHFADATSGAESSVLVVTHADARDVAEAAADAGLATRHSHARGTLAATEHAAPPECVAIEPAYRLAAIRRIVEQQIRPGDLLYASAQAARFAATLGDRIARWKRAGLQPADIEALAEARPDEQRLRELHRLFEAYGVFLEQHGQFDGEDRIAAAAADIRANGSRFASVVFAGYLRLDYLQRSILAAFACATTGNPGAYATLAFEPDRSLVFATTGRTRQQLMGEFQCTEVIAQARPRPPRPIALLERRLFERARETDLPSAPAEPITILDEATSYTEAEAVARTLLRAMDAGITPDQMAIVARTPVEMTGLFASVLERCGIEAAAPPAGTLYDQPVLRALTAAVAVVSEGWTVDRVAAWLKSGRPAVPRLDADRLCAAMRRSAAEPSEGAWTSVRGGAAGAAAAVSRLSAAGAGLLSAGGPEYAAALEAFASASGVIAAGAAEWPERDQAIWNRAREVARQVDAFRRATAAEPLGFADWFAEVSGAWRATSPPEAKSGGKVPILEPREVAPGRYRLIVVAGLLERRFPRRIRLDPWLRDDERAWLRQETGRGPDDEADRADDERYYFYLACTAPTERLVLSYPRVTDERDVLPSFFIDEVRSVFTGPEAHLLQVRTSLLADVVPSLGDAVSDEERLLAACAVVNDVQRTSDHAEARETLAVIAGSEPLGAAAAAVQDSAALPALPKIEDRTLAGGFSQPGRHWAATELETFNRCPFQHFAGYTLGLRASDEPEALLRGVILHETLREYHATEPADDRLRPVDGERLGAVARRLVQTRAAALEPSRKLLLEESLTRALDAYAERESWYREHFGFVTRNCELSFGRQSAAARNEPSDTASTDAPLELVSENASKTLVAGKIDRLDVDPATGRAIALDYKSGWTPPLKDVAGGGSLQLGLYSLASERLFNTPVAAAAYDSLRERARKRIVVMGQPSCARLGLQEDRETSDDVRPLSPDAYAEMKSAVEANAARAAIGIQSAEIGAVPGAYCEYCAYSDLCRTTRTGHDGEPMPAADAEAA